MELIVGDFASCLRASLDHLVVSLTKTPNGSPNPKALFPVISVDNVKGRDQFARAVVGVPPDVIKVIESLQPYRDGNGYKMSKLWRLHRLWNIDKHRRIPFHATGVEIKVGYPAGMQPIVGGTDYGHIMRFPLAAKGKLQIDPSVKINIEFGDVSEDIVIPYPELADIHEFVCKHVFSRFHRFF